MLTRRTRVLVGILAVIVFGGTSCSSRTGPGPFERPFAESSPWRQEIPSDAQVDPDSEAMIAAVQQTPTLNANLAEYGIPIYRADEGTQTHTVTCTRVNYGICPFAGWPVPIPDGAQSNTGSDGVLVSVAESDGIIFEFWRAAREGDAWTTEFAAVNSLHGSGWGGAATGSGASRLAGVIRVAEIAEGEIPHALALQSDNACPTFRPPALKSDGMSTRADCIPEGARLQLDPELDLESLNLSPGELAVGRAMQRYGGYLMDVADTPMSVSFERDRDAVPGELGPTYSDAGFRWDYDAMENIPWDKLRVLK